MGKTRRDRARSRDNGTDPATMVTSMGWRAHRRPSMLDHAVKAGASWEQIGAARGTSADQARRDYREWVVG
jgi:hypothetical protein